MTVKPKYVDTVPISRIFLALENPRHEPFDSEAQAIEYLCAKEDVHPLARDIAKYGLNPLERLALIPLKSRGGPLNSVNYYAAEGNRRMCALKLLCDPDRAPAKLRKSFAKLAETWTPIKSVQAAVFNDPKDFEVWLYRVHNGPQGGTGRRDWNAEQKQRFTGGSKNRVAQAFLDYAEAEGMITAEERRGKLTTVQRFVGNDVFAEVMGIDRSNPEELGRTRPKAEFDTIAKRFVRDLVEKKAVNSRMDKTAVTRYARPLGSLVGVTTARVEAEPLAATVTAKSTRPRRKRPTRPEHAKHVSYDDEIAVALGNLRNEKLVSLYHSATTIDLDPHTPIVAIGVWAFFETLTACAGRKDDVPFTNFLSKARLGMFGLSGASVSIRSALGRVHEYGNTSKHHPMAVTFNGDQLNNDMMTLKGVILKLIEDAAKAGS